MMNADQEDATLSDFPFSFFSRLWMYAGLLLFLSSDVMVGNDIDDDCISISSLSSQRPIISEDNEPRSDGALAFAGAMGVVVLVGLVKKEEFFDCPP